METPAVQRNGTTGAVTSFLAGHQAPAGVYREMETGRELRMEEDGILPATCDGHVAVYVRSPLTWAEIQPEKEAHTMSPSPLLCEQCAHAGVVTLADYVYQPEETSLAGPTMGDPDYWPPNVSGLQLLCQEHYTRFPADSRLDYVPAENRMGQSEEGEGIEL